MTRRWTSPSSVRSSLANSELMCLATARSDSPRWAATAALLQCPTDQTKTTISGTLCSYSYNLLPMMNGDRISNLLPSSIALLWDGNPNAMGSGLWWGTLCLPDTNNKVTICHNGNNTISISINALPAHLSHAGDYCGACGSNPNTANVALMNQQAVIRRHSKRLNLLFLDGHTDWVADLPSNSLN